jgi:predicted GNAT family acetyltransferase
MSNEITITLNDDGRHGRYEARVDGKTGLGELTFAHVSPNKVVANHTGVDDSLRGTGVGKALVEKLVEDARSDGFTIVPSCSFIRALYRRNPEWSDVMDA